MKLLTILSIIILCDIEHLKTTVIEPTSNEILFKPLGNLIPELSWATVRSKINISDLFKETNQLCKASGVMEKEYLRLGRKYAKGRKKIKVPPNKISDTNIYLIELLSHDIMSMCNENTKRIEEIIDVFSLKTIKKPKHIPTTDGTTAIGTLIRDTRQVIIGTVIATIGIVTSLVSIFTTNELMSMSSSKDSENDLIDNNNNIIRTLQSHENAINREKQTIQRIKSNVENLERYLSIEKETFDTYLNLFTIKVFGTTAVQHLQRLQDGLYQLLKNNLSPKLIPLSNLEEVIGQVKDIAMKRGYKLAIGSSSDIYMCQTSFVAHQNGELIILSHIPMYKNKHLMKLLEYQPTPIVLSQQSDKQLSIKPENPIIAVDEDLTLYSVYTKEEIHHDCWSIHNNHYCKNKNILTRVNENFMECTLALYRKNKNQIQEKCTLEVSKPHEVIIQLNSTTFYTYSPNDTDLFINCPEQKQDKNRIIGFNIITLKKGCRASMMRHVFTSGIEVEETIVLNKNNLNLHLKDIVKKMDDNQEDEFLQLIKEEQLKSRKPVKIVDVTRKFHLRLLKKKGTLYGSILGGGTSLITIIIIIITIVLIYKFCVKKGSQAPSNTFCRFDTQTERIDLPMLPSASSILTTASTTTTNEETVQGKSIDIQSIVSK